MKTSASGGGEESSPGAEALGECPIASTRASIAYVTSIRHSITIQPYRIAIPNPAGERTRDSAG
jgi:hypothetical protein